MIKVSPLSCLQDEKLCIQAEGLIPYQMVTVSSHLKDSKNFDFFAYANYRSDALGNVDLSRNESIGGSYTGVFQMGLLGCMKPAPHEDEFLRYFKRDVENPTKIEFRLYDGFLTQNEIFDQSINPLKVAYHFREYMAPGVKKISIREGRVRGTLFLPPGIGPYPGVIDMFGTAGGLIEFRSAQLASHGIASLALAFFDYDDLPKELKECDVTYFQEAAQLLLKQETVCKPTVGVIGVSKGAELALSAASYIPQVSLAICINGCCANTLTPLTIDGNTVLPPLMYEAGRLKIDKGAIIFRGAIYEPHQYPETIIPLGNTKAHIMFIVGEGDLSLDSPKFAKYAVEMMQKAGRTNFKLLSYQNAGHLIEPPYSPLCCASFHKAFGMPMWWGGEAKAHMFAQEDSWIQMISYIKENLHNMTRAKL